MGSRVLTASTPWGPVRRAASRNYTHVVVYPLDDRQRRDQGRANGTFLPNRLAEMEECLARADVALPASAGYATQHERARAERTALRALGTQQERVLTSSAVMAGAYAWCLSANAALAALSLATKAGYTRAIIIPVDQPNKEVP